jgi:hypothetical protein
MFGHRFDTKSGHDTALTRVDTLCGGVMQTVPKFPNRLKNADFIGVY